VATVLAGTVLATSLPRDQRFAFRYFVAAVLGLCAFAWGYAKRAFDVPAWPPLKQLGRRQYRETWDSLAESVVDSDEERLQSSSAGPLAILTRLASPTEREDVLEIGCGVGRIGAAVAPRVRTWTGVDISPNMLARATQRLSTLSNVRLYQLDGHGLSRLSSETFDLIYCINVFPHLDEMDRWEYIRESFRVLRPGGRILFDALDLASGAGWSTFERNAVELKDFNRPPYLPRFSTAEELRVYVEKAGFGQVETDRQSPPAVIVTASKPR
jgi:SAM-dependent methyltransferase